MKQIVRKSPRYLLCVLCCWFLAVFLFFTRYEKPLEMTTGPPVIAGKRPRYLGCWKEDNERIMFYRGTDGSLAGCITSCPQFKYIGMQYGGECWCGNRYRATKVDKQLSDAACEKKIDKEGNRLGGSWKNAVYDNPYWAVQSIEVNNPTEDIVTLSLPNPNKWEKDWLAKIESSRKATNCRSRYHHFLNIWNLTRSLRTCKMTSYGGYSGPWMENWWIRIGIDVQEHYNETHFCKRYGQFVPIFAQFVDCCVREHKKGNTVKRGTYKKLMKEFREYLSPEFLYAIVSQHDRGIVPGNITYKEFFGEVSENMLVFSEGGYGHVSIPLLKENFEKERYPSPSNRRDDYTHYVSFCGSVDNSRPMRQSLIPYLDKLLPGDLFYAYKGKRFRQVWESSKYVMVPRGFGRSAFMLAEVIHQGAVPVYIYDDIEFLPYKRVGEDWDFGVSIQYKDAKENLINILREADNRYDNIRHNILRYRGLLWSYQTVLDQVEVFLRDPTQSFLVARSLPNAPLYHMR